MSRRFWHSGLALVAIATFAMAFKGIFARLVYQYGVSVDALLIWRFLLAVPLFWVGALWINRDREKIRLSRRQWALCAVSGLSPLGAISTPFTSSAPAFRGCCCTCFRL